MTKTVVHQNFKIRPSCKNGAGFPTSTGKLLKTANVCNQRHYSESKAEFYLPYRVLTWMIWTSIKVTVSRIR